MASPARGDNSPGKSPAEPRQTSEAASTPHKKKKRASSSPSSSAAPDAVPDPLVKEEQDSFLPQIYSRKSTKRKRDESVTLDLNQDGETSVDCSSPSKPKKKKSKRRHSESAVFQNGDGEDVVDTGEFSPHRHKKEKVKAEEDCGGLFLVDRGGDWHNATNDSLVTLSDSNDGHKRRKKSKKEKKERQRTVT